MFFRRNAGDPGDGGVDHHITQVGIQQRRRDRRAGERRLQNGIRPVTFSRFVFGAVAGAQCFVDRFAELGVRQFQFFDLLLQLDGLLFKLTLVLQHLISLIGEASADSYKEHRQQADWQEKSDLRDDHQELVAAMPRLIQHFFCHYEFCEPKAHGFEQLLSGEATRRRRQSTGECRERKIVIPRLQRNSNRPRTLLLRRVVGSERNEGIELCRVRNARFEFGLERF